MPYKQIWKHGHSYVVTLSADELIHMGLDHHDYVRVEKTRASKVILSAPPRNNAKGVPRPTGN